MTEKEQVSEIIFKYFRKREIRPNDEYHGEIFLLSQEIPLAVSLRPYLISTLDALCEENVFQFIENAKFGPAYVLTENGYNIINPTN